MQIDEKLTISDGEYYKLRKIAGIAELEIKKFLARNGFNPPGGLEDVAQKLNKFNLTNVSDVDFLTCYVWFISDMKESSHGYFMHQFKNDKFSNKPLIVINLYKAVDWDSWTLNVEKLYDTYDTIVHEYIHFQQYKRFIQYRNFKITIGDLRGIAVNMPFPTKKKYLDRPHEQSAWGHGFAEYFKTLRAKYHIDPDSFINRLKVYGLWGYDDLENLKRKDFNAWKKIMKAAVHATKGTDKEINEGALTSTDAQEKIIRDFLDDIHNTIGGALIRNDSISIAAFKKMLIPFENRNLSATPKVKLTTKFVFRNLGDETGWLAEKVPNKHYELAINLGLFITASKSFDEFDSYVTAVKWTELYSTFIHEYKHFLQTLKANGANFNVNQNVDYYDQPGEQQAHAEAYLERLKNQLHTTDSNVILNYLRNNALTASPSLYALKQSNPSAWRKIMKQAVLAAVRDSNK